MTLKEIQSLTLEEFQQLSPKQQKSAVSTLASAYNKRIARLEAHEGGKGSPAYQSRNVDITNKGRFSVKGKSGKTLAAEFKRAQYFGNLKTGSVSGYEEYQKSAALQDTKHGGTLSKNLANSAWDAFNRIKEKYPAQLADGSDASEKMVKYLKEVIGDRKYNTFDEGELENLLDAKAQELEESTQIDMEALQSGADESDFLDTDESGLPFE